MRMVKLAGVVSALLAAHVFAASTVTFTLELSAYDDSYRTAWKSRVWNPATKSWTTPPAYFTPGNPDDDQVFHVGDIITWDLKVAVDPEGAHETDPAGGPGHGYKPNGLANLVFNLQLEDTSGEPITSFAGGSAPWVLDQQGFFSAINDNTGGDPDRKAAFALSFNCADPTVGRGPGRAIDQLNDTTPPNGGPDLGGPLDAEGKGTFTYPSVVGGSLLGQGCGYQRWYRYYSNKTLNTTPGVAMEYFYQFNNPTPQTGLGVVPICEGQLNTKDMAPGTYVLRAVPGAGINVLRGDVDLVAYSSSSVASFAVGANAVQPDTIRFTLEPPVVCTTPTVVTAVSRKTHGSAGDYDIPFVGFTATNAGGSTSIPVECRSNGVTQALIRFDQNMAAVDGNVDVGSEVVVTCVSADGPVAVTANGASITGDTLTIAFANMPAAAFGGSCLQITLNNLCVAGEPTCLLPQGTCVSIKMLRGDVTGDGKVRANDISATKASFTDINANPNYFRRDAVPSATILANDISLVKASGGDISALPCACQ